MKKNILRTVSLFLLLLLVINSIPAKVMADEGEYELEDITPLKDAVCETLNDDEFIVGAAATFSELCNDGIEALIEKHFNAVTFGNELKPDALFGYSNGTCPGKHSVEFNGETMDVPTMDFSRAERMLDIIKKWNDANPDNIIKVRGHVLVWHSQTPEWFFHEDYDKNKDYVKPAEMNKRLEWYISEVLTHFTGPDSKYAGMFYGWDVVNEAISDGTNSYRTDKENANESLLKDTHGSNSSWWHVYESNEYIINAFKYANKYAPEDLDLYYNDYGDCSLMKCKGIVQLINDVKAAPGTRIDGFGMQGHYSAGEMMQDKFGVCAKNYMETGVKVMITEWDMTASGNYDSTDEESVVSEYTRMGHRYEGIYKKIIELKEAGYPIAGFTFWGTIDKYSWLQSRSDVGGGSKTGNPQCPLLFDDNFKAKPAYWAFVDFDKINDMNTEYKAKVKAEKEAAENGNEAVDTSDESDTPDEDNTTDEALDTAVVDSAAPETETSESAADETADSGNRGPVATGITTVIALLLIGTSALAIANSKKKNNKEK